MLGISFFTFKRLMIIFLILLVLRSMFDTQILQHELNCLLQVVDQIIMIVC